MGRKRLKAEHVFRWVWDTGESMTSSGQVLFASVNSFSGVKARGAWRLFDCQPEPVGPVVGPQDLFSPVGSGKIVLLSLTRYSCCKTWIYADVIKNVTKICVLSFIVFYESILFQVKNWFLCCILNENYGTARSWWQSVSQLDDSSALI